ncbi:hypothetical protein SmJEL517_g03259 [Synchytrium microbalum]|uniref:SEC7 domain-containing protein n=1 Tax=Synchytrium microbalum TaxID=1806994 RepID=A0A507C7N3_9FUNG|nr:uncharacterized protein SmJEL517_g03259 [Synchytrium microbalum]TPX34074.1 hypothetical protein SmJEL517_g03259 [Synchytrium microbalum]
MSLPRSPRNTVPKSSNASQSSDVFIKLALEQLSSAKEGKKILQLRDSCSKASAALEALSVGRGDPSISIAAVFLPFQIACESRIPILASIAIDCLGKLFTYNYWSRYESHDDAASENGTNNTNKRTSTSSRGRQSRSDDDDTADDEARSSLDIEGDREDGGASGSGIVAQVIDTICDTFAGGETTDERVQLQIIKALAASVSSPDPKSGAHGGVLLKAIRTTYNIFLLSKSPTTQLLAQSSLTQMVQAVFERIPRPPKQPIIKPGNTSPTSPVSDGSSSSVVVVEGVATERKDGDSPTATAFSFPSGSDTSSKWGSPADSTDKLSISQDNLHELGSSKGADLRASHDILAETFRGSKTPTISRDPVLDTNVKDVYLVFRALCKLSMKTVPTEGATDLKSHAMRSKLLALHLVDSVLASNLYVFFTPAGVLFSSSQNGVSASAILFIHAVKQYLGLTLSRNASSAVPQVFDVAMQIFGKVLIGLRTVLKRELSVIMTEIILPILEARSSITFHQRISCLNKMKEILADPAADGGRVLVEIYLNYDCDVEAGARENIWERLMNALGKVMTTHYAIDPAQQQQQNAGGVLAGNGPHSGVAPAITTANLTNLTREQLRGLYSATGDYAELKKRGLELMVNGVMKPLVDWCVARGGKPGDNMPAHDEQGHKKRKSEDGHERENTGGGLGLLSEEEAKKRRQRGEDDPTQFESLKQRKQISMEGVKRFNFKPKKGLQFLLDQRIIPSRTPRDIARFLLRTEGLAKQVIGEFLGEGDEENIAIMHAFVDEMDMTNMRFVEALRTFLQSFRLPGEAQKIDRFMLKFAERYLKGNSQTFTSADTAYVLAYSVVMLNTDQHNTQVKRRMTKADFVKNNRGIDEGKDLPVEFLEAIFDEIATNEIVMKDERPDKESEKAADKAAAAQAPNSALRTKKELAQFANASQAMAQKSEAMFNNISKSKTSKKGASGHNLPSAGGNSQSESATSQNNNSMAQFYAASHYEHVKPMFQLIWMAVLTGCSGPLQESEDLDTIALCLDGFKYAIRIICLFDMDLEKQAFLSTLSKFTQLSNLAELRPKNLEAIRTLLEIAVLEGNYLGDTWRDVVVCVSQLEKLQILSGGGGPGGDNGRVSRSSEDPGLSGRRESHVGGNRQVDSKGKPYVEMTVDGSMSMQMTLAVDHIFTSSVRLSGTAIVEFVRALCLVSWDEITSSSDREHPRMYCLQRLVEISYYNMKRIRMEWSNIWAILGDHFNQVGCHHNSNVGFFALDKLRQMAMKFLELEELPNFKFQKDFLRPFEHVLGFNQDPKIKDMVLACLQQMVQAKAKSMKSGWKTLFAAFIRAAREPYEPVVLLAFDIVKSIFRGHFESVVANGTFADFISCLVEFCKNKRFGKISLQSIEVLRQAIPRMADLAKSAQGSKLLQQTINAEITTQASVGNVFAPSKIEEDPSLRFWFPILFGLYEVIMTCDLEVRTRGLTYLFDTLKTYGGSFSRDFWEVVSKGVLFPIFDDLRLSKQEHTKFPNKEDMSVWLSTTLIQALRQFVDLFSHYFETLSFQLDGVLELLTVCMTQENETLARIGSTCLQQFIENNVQRLTDDVWEKLCKMLVNLFEITTPNGLFFDIGEYASNSAAPSPKPTRRSVTFVNGVATLTIDGVPASEQQQQPQTTLTKPIEQTFGSKLSNTPPASPRPLAKRPEKREFQAIIVKCVLHLLVIQTLHEILSTGQDAVYRSLTIRHLGLLIDCLERSYRFAQRFNNDMDLRMALYKMGFMKQLPNLLKQETTSISSYLMILIKMYSDSTDEKVAIRLETEKRLIPLSYDVMCLYNSLDPETKRRNVNAWRPVVVSILNALLSFSDEQFKRHIPLFYNEVVNLLLQEVPNDLRLVLHALLIRAGNVYGVTQRERRVSRADSIEGDAASMSGGGGGGSHLDLSSELDEDELMTFDPPLKPQPTATLLATEQSLMDMDDGVEEEVATKETNKAETSIL